jgi:hypothetical protein
MCTHDYIPYDEREVMVSGELPPFGPAVKFNSTESESIGLSSDYHRRIRHINQDLLLVLLRQLGA